MHNLVLSIEGVRDSLPANKGTLIALSDIWTALIAEPFMEAITRFRGPKTFYRRRTHFTRATRMAWISAVLEAAGEPPISSTSELSWEVAIRFVRWLQGEHPDHGEFTENQVVRAQAARVGEINHWLFYHGEDVWLWEVFSRSRAYTRRRKTG